MPFELDISNNCIVLSSDIRLPFDPKGDALRLKNELRSAIKGFNKSEYVHLFAGLTTSEDEFFDVENILFYNMGSGTFSHLEMDELTFKLIKGNPKAGYKYQYEYSLVDSKTNTAEEQIIAEFSFDIDKVTGDQKPLNYWYAYKTGKVDMKKIEVPRQFGMSITVQLQEKHKNITSIIKPMLDGIISAMHYQNEVEDQVFDVIEHKLNIDKARITRMLTDSKYAVLGERNVVYPYRGGIKWNPEDEKCVSVNIKQKEVTGIDKPRIRGVVTLYEENVQ